VTRFLDRNAGWSPDDSARVWPHRDPGDGQFVARLVRSDDGPMREWPHARTQHADRAALADWRAFRAAALPGFEPDDDAVVSVGDRLYLAPEQRLDSLSRPGLPLGRRRPGRFEPAHALATAVRPEHAAQRADCTPEYLHGEAVPSPGPDGWTLVTYERWGLGWARRTRGVLKNFFPKHLRRAG
jgi:NOL1/NOP2/fmu family ribosome biogenesis protein